MEIIEGENNMSDKRISGNLHQESDKFMHFVDNLLGDEKFFLLAKSNPLEA